ncbi:SGNH/GDSL hydrolase family protein [Maioricimonas sp. JC845]|uniref:SGNH/GDSL hydrolase family protein n=1 Tax=Maioricimonas sp. JC845 TaxID=3232138 RepID=UPI00345935BA
MTNPIEPNTSRRTFFSQAALGAAGLAAAGQLARTATAADDAPSKSLIGENDVILFQGDSITDAGRDRKTAGQANHQAALGKGYAWMAAAELLTSHPDAGLQIYNRGISGNKVYQLADRWQADCLDLKPNVVSILIGVNDIWHKLNGRYDGTVEVYEKDYRALLERTRKALPDVRLVICEPFVLRCGAVNDSWFPAFDEYRAAAKRVSDAFDATFVPYQTMFDTAVQYAPPEHWAGDGVHPSPYGASLMASFWTNAVLGHSA